MAAEHGNHKSRGHALCSASGAERWLNCPGSVCMSQGLPEVPPGPAALEGTRCHELAERILKEWLRNGRNLYLGFVDSLRPEYADTEIPTGDGRMWSMVDYAMTYVNVCIERAWGFDRKDVPVRIEQRLVLDEGMKMFGTADLLITGPKQGEDVGEILDLKYGKKKVKADSPQFAYYACALRKTSTKKLKRIKVTAVQPRLDEFYSELEYDHTALDAWEQRLILGAEKALMQAAIKKPELNVGSWCWFCPARSVCPEYERVRAQKAQEKAAGLFEDSVEETAV